MTASGAWKAAGSAATRAPSASKTVSLPSHSRPGSSCQTRFHNFCRINIALGPEQRVSVPDQCCASPQETDTDPMHQTIPIYWEVFKFRTPCDSPASVDLRVLLHELSVSLLRPTPPVTQHSWQSHSCGPTAATPNLQTHTACLKEGKPRVEQYLPLLQAHFNIQVDVP